MTSFSSAQSDAEAQMLLKRALSMILRVPVGDPDLDAVVAAARECAPKHYMLRKAGHGTVKAYWEGGWIKSTAIEISDLPDVQNRRPALA